MRRKNFYLSEKQIKNLETDSMNKDLSTSEILRRIIDDHFQDVYPLSGMAVIKPTKLLVLATGTI